MSTDANDVNQQLETDDLALLLRIMQQFEPGGVPEPGSPTALQALTANRRLGELLVDARMALIRAAREDDASWRDIGTSLDVTRQAAQRWFAERASQDPQRILVPDTEEFVDLANRAGDVLEYIDDVDEYEATAGTPLSLPAPLTGAEALKAMRRVYDVLEASLDAFPGKAPGTRVLAPDGRYEHAPFRVVGLDREDIAALVRAAEVTTAAAAAPHTHELRSVLADFNALDCRSSWGGAEEFTAGAVAHALSNLVDLLTIEHDDDIAALATSLATDQDVVLTITEQSTYNRLANRFNKLLTSGDPLVRFEY
jgi:hypothetical protein